MITRDELIPVIVRACPSFAPSWLEYQAERSPVSGYGVELDRFAEHVAWLLISDETTELPAVMAVLDRIRREGEFYFLRLVATQTFVDSLASHLNGSGLSPAVLLAYVPEESRAFWERAIADPMSLDRTDLPPEGAA